MKDKERHSKYEMMKSILNYFYDNMVVCSLLPLL